MKRGFLFYVGFLLLIVFGGFLVMLVIMFCSPGKEILGMKYFKGDGTKLIETTTDDSAIPLNLVEEGKYSKIEINCNGFANVKVQKSNTYKKDCIAIVNNASGFVRTKDEVQFSYSVLIDGDVLKINMTEPVGFLFFSKNIQVVVHLASVKDESDKNIDPFGNTDFVINTKGGSITIGGDSSPHSYDMSVGTLTLNSGNGNISITNRINISDEGQVQTLKNLSLSIGSGSFQSSAKNLFVIGNCDLQSTSGKYQFNTLVASKDVRVKTESGRIDAEQVGAQNVVVECNDGYFYLKTVSANLKFPSADMTIKSPFTKIDKLGGELIVLAGQNSSFEINEVIGNVNIQNVDGRIKIGDGKNGGVSDSIVVKTKNGSTKVTIKDGNNKAKEFDGENANFDIYFAGQARETTAINTKGNVNVKFVNGNAYTFIFNRFSSNEDYDMNKVRFTDFPSFTKDDIKNPFVYYADKTDRGYVDIHADGNVNLSFIANNN